MTTWSCARWVAGPSPSPRATTVCSAPIQPIAVKPGKPTWFSRQGKRLALGLPGNPAAARRILLTDPLPPLPPDRASNRLLRLACRLGDAQIVGSDQTWENWIAPSQCVDYVVPDGFTNQGHLLTIEPGVRAAFGPRAVLLIRSHSAGIRAVGTEEEPIVLTGMAAERGNWGTLWLDGSAHVENRIEHVTIEYGGDANLSGSITQGNLLLTGDTETTLDFEGLDIGSMERDGPGKLVLRAQHGRQHRAPRPRREHVHA